MAWPPEPGPADDSAAARAKRIVGAYNRALVLLGLLAVAGVVICAAVLLAG